MRPILFLVSAASSYRLQQHVADELVRQGRRVAFLYERGDDAAFAQLTQDAARLGGDAYALADAINPEIRSAPLFNRHPGPAAAQAIAREVERTLTGRKLGSLAIRTLPASITHRAGIDAALLGSSRLEALRNQLASRLAAVSTLLARTNAAAIVACEDGISSDMAVHAAARHAGVPVIVVPYGYGVRRDLEIALDGRAHRGDLMRAGGRWTSLIREHAPQWIKQGHHQDAMMYAEDYVVAAESLGITVRDSWIIHGGYADRLCVESEQMRRVYIEEGVPPAKLAPTGTPYCDVMTSALQGNPAAAAVLRQPKRIDAAITRILVSWPPSYHAERAQFSEFPSYREMSLATLGWLSRLPNCAVTVSLHPATLADDRQALIDIGVQLTDDYIIELIPQNDLFVTYFSSTIRWSIAAGKPAVNFDLYKLGLTVYDAAPGVMKVSSLAEFQSEMTQLTSSERAFAEAAERNIAVAGEWGTLDGRNTARVAAEIAGLAAA